MRESVRQSSRRLRWARTEARKTRFRCARPGWQAIEDDKHPARGYRAGYRLAGPEVVFTIDTGVCAVWGAHFLRAAPGRRLSGSFNHGSIANSLMQAIRAQMAYPDLFLRAATTAA
jgi:pyruvate dehydrogenase (quinone)